MVFCGKCKYYNIGRNGACNHPDNITIRSDWEMHWKSYTKKPNSLNKKNDCKWFEKR